MIQFKKRGGRYEPFKDGEKLDLGVQRDSRPVQGVFARGSCSARHDKDDELYEEMQEGPLYEDVEESQDEPKQTPKETELEYAQEHRQSECRNDESGCQYVDKQDNIQNIPIFKDRNINATGSGER